MKEILNVIYVSVWDGGYEIESSAKYNTHTKEVFDIEVVEGIDEEGDEVQALDEEYILLPNGEKVFVYEKDGDYFAKPPALRFDGAVKNVDEFCNELNGIILKDNDIDVYQSVPTEVNVEPLNDTDWITVVELAKLHKLNLKQ